MTKTSSDKNFDHFVDFSRIGFIGLGNMGDPMALHLLKKFHNITVFNRTFQKAADWTQKYQTADNSIYCADTLKTFANTTQIICLCVGNDQDVINTVRELITYYNEKQISVVFIDHTTISPDTVRLLAQECEKEGHYFIDAPVSGGQVGAQNGVLTLMGGGDAVIFEKMRPIFECFTAKCSYFGNSGMGQTVKIINQISIAHILQGLSEGLQIAVKQGLDVGLVAETLSLGAAGSWQMKNRSVTMTQKQYDFGFAIDWLIKDLKIAQDFAQKNEMSLPQTSEILKIYERLSNEGFGRCDTSALIKQFL